MNWRRALWVWGVIVVVEVAHGMARELFIAPVLGDRPARQLGVLVGSGLIILVAVLTIRWIGAIRCNDQLRVGAVWVALIVVFEVALGLALGDPPARLLEDYDLTAGGYMGLGLTFMLFAPALAYQMRQVGWPAHLAMALAFLLLTITMFIALLYQRDIQPAYARIGEGSRVAMTPCGPIEYATAGFGTPVLIVHGSGGGFDQGLRVLGALAEQGFELISVSRFGYLRTPLPDDASAQAQADAHACLLDALGYRQVAIAGASAGAPSALKFALRHPERTRALILLVPALYAPRPDGVESVITPPGTQSLFDTALKSDLLFWVAPRVARSLVISAILATPPQQVAQASEAERARVDAMIDGILPVRPRRAGLINDAAVTTGIERYPLEAIAVPTLVISAEDDLFGTFDAARHVAESVPGARFLALPDGGHVWVGHHEQVMATMATFLRAHR